MAKQPKAGKADKHKSSFVVRLPESYREPMKKLTAKTRRPITTETQIALDERFAKEGIELPASST